MLNLKRIIARTLSVSVLMMSLPVSAISASAGTVLLNASFESGTDGFAARASESVSRVNTQAYDGQYSLLVSSRTEAWNGAVMPLGTDWASGGSYSFSCAVYQTSGGAVDMQLSLQYDDASGETQYAHIAAGSVGSGEWTILSNPEYQIPANASNRYLYVETVESLCDFYVDSVISEEPSTEPPAPVFRRGDVNRDEKIDKQDVAELMAWLLTKDAGANVNLDTADMDGNGILTAADLSMLRQLFKYPELTSTTTTTTTTTTTQTTTTTTQTTPAETQPPQLQPGQWYNRADISWIDTSKPMVAISFDDGPISFSNEPTRIHNALTESGFHATFFYWGNRINDGNQGEILEAEKRGFEVANHSWTHTNLSTLGPQEILSEYQQCADKLNSILGVKRDYLIRLPYLGYSATVGSTLPVPAPNCGVDSQDWNGASADQIINTIKSGMANGSLNGQVVLMHENYDSTATAMEYLCPYMKQQGWQIVTVSEMFKANGKDMWAGKVYNNCW